MRQWLKFGLIAGVTALSAPGAWAHYAEEDLEKSFESMESIVDPVYNVTVKRSIDRYFNTSEKEQDALLLRSYRYFPLIEQKLHEAGLPEELKYLTIIESALHPTIRSRAGAAGLWQLMIPTARHCGLRINWAVDERLDPEKSTEAAIFFIKELYEQFDDWALVMAAYNAGPGRLRRALRLSGSRDFWKVARFLPRETRNYVPKFLAAQYFYSHKLQFDQPSIQLDRDLLFTTTIPLTESISLSELANYLPVSRETLRDLNPSWRRDRIGDGSGRYDIRIPTRAVEDYEQYLYFREKDLLDRRREQLPHAMMNAELTSPYVQFQYAVGSGESLEDIAQFFELNPHMVRWWNGLKLGETLSRGQKLTLWMPKSSSCNYLVEILQGLKKPADFLPALEVEVFEREFHPFNGSAPKSLPQIDDLSDQYRSRKRKPRVIPRGVSEDLFVQYLKAGQQMQAGDTQVTRLSK